MKEGSIKGTRSEQQRGSKIGKTTIRTGLQWLLEHQKIQHSYHEHQGEEKECEAKRMFKEIMAENFPHLTQDTHLKI